MNLLEQLLQAQGGGAVRQLAEKFGMDETQAQSAIKSMLPALSSGLKQNMQDPEKASNLVGMMQKGKLQRLLEEPDAIDPDDADGDGDEILGQLFGNSTAAKETVAEQAAASTGLDANTLQGMLPVIASMVMGSLGKQTASPEMASQMQGLLGGASGGGASGLGGMVGKLLGGLTGGGQQQAQGNPLGALGSLLDADGDGSVMDDIFEKIAKR